VTLRHVKTIFRPKTDTDDEPMDRYTTYTWTKDRHFRQLTKTFYHESILFGRLDIFRLA